MKKISPFLAISFCVATLFWLSSYSVSAQRVRNCPRCYSDKRPMAGHGAALDGTGRRRIYIKIADELSEQVPLSHKPAENVRVALEGGIDL